MGFTNGLREESLYRAMGNKIFEIKPQYVELMPKNISEGILYISEEYKTAIHLCACGCGEKTVTPLAIDEWTITKTGDLITLRPSIGNFAGEDPYHAHYFITENKIEWV